MTWWTEADQAELDVAVWELVTVAESHNGKCAACREARAAGRNFCEPMSDAIQAVCDWKERRDLLSRAQFFRALWNVREARQ